MLGDAYDVSDMTAHPHLPLPEETGETFEANATIKALAASSALPDALVLSDDSGLEVDALGGAPGVISARYAGANATDSDNRRLLKEQLAQLAKQTETPLFNGRFRCCMVLAQNGRVLGVFDGAVEGCLLLAEDGGGGFGYDPLFVPEGYENSFGVLPLEVKNQLSHRSRALAKVVAWLAEQA